MPTLITDQSMKSIPVFPIHSNTIIGTLDEELTTTTWGYTYGLLHSEEGDVYDFNEVTITYSDLSTTVVNLIAGSDIGLSKDTLHVTTTKNVWLS